MEPLNGFGCEVKEASLQSLTHKEAQVWRLARAGIASCGVSPGFGGPPGTALLEMVGSVVTAETVAEEPPGGQLT